MSDQNSILIETKNLTKDFGHGKGAFDINLNLKKGEIIGFIGPNGAGKTTTISMILGLIKPTRGSVKLFDQEIDVTAVYQQMPKIGLMLSDIAFEPLFSGKQILHRNAALLNKKLDSEIQKLADYYELDLSTKFGNLSFGNKRKVGIINALMHSPELLILDEPTSGLDPLNQQKFLQDLKAVTNRGGSVFLSSHVLSEIQAVCDKIIMVKKGKVILVDSTESILKNALKVFKINNLDPVILDKIIGQKLAQEHSLINRDAILFVSQTRPMIEFLVAHDIYDFYIEKPNLEEMFLKYYE